MKNSTRYSCGQLPTHGHFFGTPDTANYTGPRASSSDKMIRKIKLQGWKSKHTGLPYGRSGDKLVRKAMTRRVGLATIR